MVTTAIVKGNHKAGEIQGQNREYSRLFNLLGAKHITIGVNRMDCDTAVYMQMRYDESANVMKSMLIMVGWKQDTVEKNTSVLPISGCLGDNLPEKSKKMGWCKNTVVECGIENFHCGTVYDMLDKLFLVPERPLSALMRMLVSDIYLMKGFGDVLAGRVERGQLKLGVEVIFLPTHSVSYMQMHDDGFTNEMKNTLIKGDLANFGDDGGLNIKGLNKQKMLRFHDVTVHTKGTTLDLTREFDAQIQVLNILIEIKFGYSPIAFVHFSRSAYRISVLERKMGKETGDKKMEDPLSLKLKEVALSSFQPKQPLMCDIFKNCEGLSCVVLTNASGVVKLGKVISCERKEEGSGGGKKK